MNLPWTLTPTPTQASLRRIRTKPRYSPGFSSDAAQANSGLHAIFVSCKRKGGSCLTKCCPPSPYIKRETTNKQTKSRIPPFKSQKNESTVHWTFVYFMLVKWNLGPVVQNKIFKQWLDINSGSDYSCFVQQSLTCVMELFIKYATYQMIVSTPFLGLRCC